MHERPWSGRTDLDRRRRGRRRQGCTPSPTSCTRTRADRE